MQFLLVPVFRRLSHIIYDYWYFFLVGPLLTTAVCSIGFAYLDERNVEQVDYVFVPTDGPSHFELACLKEHWPLNPMAFVPGKHFGMKYWIEVIVVAKRQNGNLLEPEILDEALNITDRIQTEFYVTTTTNNTRYYYDRRCSVDDADCLESQLCLNDNGECFQNKIVEMLAFGTYRGEFFDLTYPRADLDNQPKDISDVVGGVRLNDSAGHIASLRGLRLLYYLRDSPAFTSDLSYKWMYQLIHFVENHHSENIQLATFNTYTLRDSLKNSAYVLMPKFTVTFIVLTVFSTMCSLITTTAPWPHNPKRHLRVVDWISSKPGLALGGVLAAGMGVISGLGFPLLTGITEFHTVVTTMPFVIMSIGVDDMFLMLSSWRHTNPNDSGKKRLEHTMCDAAVSITITSLTNTISFGTGAITTVPGVRIFSLFTMFATTFSYVYQITFFAALMVVAEKLETKRLHCVLWCYKIPDSSSKSNWSSTLLAFGRSSSPEPSVKVKTDFTSQFFGEKFAPLLLDPIGQVVIVASAAIYLVFAAWGCTKLQQGLEPRHLLLPTDHAVIWYDQSADIFWPEGPQLQVVINNPPLNLSIEHHRQQLRQAVHAFSNTKYTMRENATHFWLTDYLRFLAGIGINVTDPAQINKPSEWSRHGRLGYWLDIQNGGQEDFHWDVKWGDISRNVTPPQDPNLIYACRATVGMRHFSHINDHRGAAELARSIAARFPDLNITTYHPYWPFADQYIIILPNTIGNVAMELCMAAVLFVVIAGLTNSALITLTIVMIDIGVVGYMTWWGVNLDAISMITIIMSIGLSVDLSAHIAYGFTTASGTSNERLVATFRELGSPVVEGVASSVLGLLVLASVDAYIIQTFFKTLFLVIMLGMLNGLVYLPLMLKYTHDICELCSKALKLDKFKKSARDRLHDFAHHLRKKTVCRFHKNHAHVATNRHAMTTLR